LTLALYSTQKPAIALVNAGASLYAIFKRSIVCGILLSTHKDTFMSVP